ncbi:MAG: 1,4-alpha-glucan branching protein GlgB [Candidatus Atribacteria bacterium]|nr:1,4-alpha-glucan branching protein GlgB [Candidatus Atribacteria bacterium]
MKKENKIIPTYSIFSKDDVFLFNEGTHYQLYQHMGAHLGEEKEENKVHFAVWAPNAEAVSVIGDFNNWQPDSHPLKQIHLGSGIWEGTIINLDRGEKYKYHIKSRYQNYRVDKRDPFAFYGEKPPATASIIWDLSYQWQDGDWMEKRQQKNQLNQPFSIYEVHLGSWRRKLNPQNDFLSYREIAPQLAQYVKDNGFTHVELLPVMEHPFYGSWGYQTIGYFSPTSRYGTPQDFMYLIDFLHQQGIGVILDWVPSHFPGDEPGLVYFDGTHLYEHADPRQGFHPDWDSYIFNYGRREVQAFLISSALFWLDYYHADGLRVDAVASMLYLDYSRKEGEWIPNRFGGRENLEAIDFIKKLNETAYSYFPNIQMIAEESTAWPMVSRPTYLGGLGFGMKWNMGWMHDTLSYFSRDPIYRKYHHQELTFSLWYAFNENFILSLSHDEVTQGKRSLLEKMPGDDWQKFANLRLLFGYMFAHPGKKLLFMGSEFGQRKEWQHDLSLDWPLLNRPDHQGIQKWIKDLNHFYQQEKALYEVDFENAGFQWIESNDWEHSVLIFLRKNRNGQEKILIVCNFVPTPWYNYRVGVPEKGTWQECLNSDASTYGGSGHGNLGKVKTIPIPIHGNDYSVNITIPPLSIIFFKKQKT